MIDFWLAMLINEGTSATLPAKLVAISTGVALTAILAGVMFAIRWIYLRLTA